MPTTRSISHAPMHWPMMLLLAATVCCAGCGPSGPNMALVKGKVLLNGQPLITGSVITIPKAGRGAKAFIASDGSFELGTFKETDGAIVGPHKVAVVAYERLAHPTPESPNGKLLVPQRFINVESSGMSIDVEAGKVNTPTLNLTSP